MKVKKILAYIVSAFFILLLWQLTAHKINAPLILPPPLSVFKTLLALITRFTFWNHFLHTLARIFISFAVTLVLGFLLGLATSASQFFHDFLELPVSIIRSTPIIAFILIAIFWFTSGVVPVFVAVLMTLPIMTDAVYTGFCTCDSKLLEMAKVFQFTRSQSFRYVKLPQCKNYIITGALSTFGLSWKVVVAGEVLSLPANAIGTILQKSQVHLETNEVMAVTIFIVVFSFTFEKIGNFFVRRISK